MKPDPEIPSSKSGRQVGDVPPLLPACEPPVIGGVAPLAAGTPPPRTSEPRRKGWPVRQLFAILLSLCLVLFLADAVVSLVDDSLILCFDFHVFTSMRGMLFLFTTLAGIAIYGLMGLTPMIPKRRFLPLALFNPLAGLVVVPFAIYCHGRLQQVAWIISLCQVIFGLAILHLVQGGFRFHWPLVPEKQFKARSFSWLNLAVFLLVNAVILIPAVIIYLLTCAGLAVDHFSEGFLTLRPGGLTVQVRTYVRDDGKTVQLFPMSHIGDSGFYQTLSRSFPTNSIILMEGVSDDRNLLTNKITYKRMASSLGLAEQQKEFNPSQGEMVPADVDVEQFAKTTLDFLNLVMRFHSKGVNAETLLSFMLYSPPPHFEEQLFDDLLKKRNRRLLEELHSRLSETEHIIVPWGVAHMPEIAKEIQKSGFRLDETREYVAIRFHAVGGSGSPARKIE